MTHSVDVLVIGAGVLGTFHAYFAARKGYKTMLLERNPLPDNASTRNFGMIAQSIAEGGDWFEYARATAEIYREIHAEWDISVRPTGSLYIASTELEARVLREFAERAAPRYTCGYLGADEVRYRYPFVRASYGAAALLFPDDLTLEPRQLLRRLIPYIGRAARVEYAPDITVISVARSGQGCLATDAAGHTYAADTVIVCGDAEYRTLFPDRLEASLPGIDDIPLLLEAVVQRLVAQLRRQVDGGERVGSRRRGSQPIDQPQPGQPVAHQGRAGRVVAVPAQKSTCQPCTSTWSPPIELIASRMNGTPARWARSPIRAAGLSSPVVVS